MALNLCGSNLLNVDISVLSEFGTEKTFYGRSKGFALIL
jgi:hypothetical protein